MPDDPLITGQGTENEIHWDIERNSVKSMVSQVPRTPAAIPGIPVLDDGSSFSAKWSLSAEDVLTLQDVTFTEVAKASAPHRLSEYFQWRNFRLIQFKDDHKTVVSEKKFTLKGACTEVVLLNRSGRRANSGGSEGKLFAWGISAGYQVKGLEIASLKYTAKIKIVYLFGAPDSDIEPTGTVTAVKVYPALEFVLVPEFQAAGSSNSLISFGASLKTVVAPRLTSADQHREGNLYDPESLHDTQIASLFSDSNGLNRNPPGGFPPRYPEWNRVFDYAEPDLKNEYAFQAVVYTRMAGDSTPFHITKYSPPSDAMGAAFFSGTDDLECYRSMGQGEFDNIHIHPYVGSDNPAGAKVSDGKDVPMVEAPIAADEVVHLHWRWGYKLPGAADSPEVAKGLRGYGIDGTPNKDDGAPLIAPNQSLRIKVARPRLDGSDTANDNCEDPPRDNIALDPKSTAIWYCPIVYTPDHLAVNSFFGHGYAFAYKWPGKGPVNNGNLLDDPNVVFCYHSLRWDRSGNQRVPTASTLPGLSRNRIFSNDPAFDKNTF